MRLRLPPLGGTLRKLAVRAVSLLAASSGLTRLRRRRRHRRGDFRLYVLEYHDVAGGVEHEGTVSTERFRRHLRYLKQRFRIDTLAAAYERLEAPGGPGRDLLAITFDDGYAGNYEDAWPVLREGGVPATFYLTTGFLDGAELWFDFARRAIDAARRGAPEVAAPAIETLRDALGSWPPVESTDRVVRRLKYLRPARRDLALGVLRDTDLELAPAARPLTWDQAVEMAAAGAELGAHTVTHPILSTLEPAAQEEEIRRSRRRIAEVTGHEPVSFAYPNGSARDYDRHTVEITGRLGFRAACTTRRGSNRPGENRLTLKRIGIGSDPLFVVEARLAGLFDEEVRSRLRR